MSTAFPGGIDQFVNPTANQQTLNPPHHQQHADANDAIHAIETKVGADGSADPASLDYRVRTLEGGTGHTHVSGEVPVGAMNGTNVTFTLAHSPNPAGSLMLFLNGLLQRPGGNDFTLSGSSITFTTAPSSGDYLVAHYII